MKIKDILGLSNARLIIGNNDDILSNFSKDTRFINAGDTYIAFIGNNFDGNNFYQEAFFKGAKTCILSSINEDKKYLIEQFPDKNIILVDDTMTFITEAAKLKRQNINVPIIAVTGSVGKTSTKNLIALVLKQKYQVLKTPGNLNTQIGLSLTLLNYQNEECIVLEMGMNKFGEISNLTAIARPTIGVITNIGTSHIGNLGSRENILQAKLEILEGLEGPLLINNDNDLLHNWYINNQNQEIISFGITEKSDYQAQNVKYLSDGCKFSVADISYHIPVLGNAFIYNSLVAIAIGQKLNINEELIKKALNNIPQEEHRMQILKNNNYTIIDDTYNASYDSVSLALDIINYMSGRKIVVLGDILELGDFSKSIHENIGLLISSKKPDLLITVGSMSYHINLKAEASGYPTSNSYHFKNKEDVIPILKKNLKDNDIILIKASHSMNFKDIVEELIK